MKFRSAQSGLSPVTAKAAATIAANFAFVLLAAVFVVSAQSRPPAVFINRKICPGEGCDYRGRAKVVAATRVYRLPSARSGTAFRLPLGTMVTGIDSQVHTRAGRYVVRRAFKDYQKGDVLHVYTYLGEGYFRVWHRGRMFEEDLAFSVWGGSSGTRCKQDVVACWGVLEKPTDMKWWLKVRTNNGRVGWMLVEENLHWDE